MHHIFYMRGLITEDTEPCAVPDRVGGVYLGSKESYEQAKEYVYSCECGAKLESLGEKSSATIVILHESDIYLRIPVRQLKQIYTIDELKKSGKWK